MTIANRTGWVCAALVGFALFGWAETAAAQNPSPEAIATAREIVELKGADKIYDPIYYSLIEKAKYSLLQSNPMLQSDLNAAAVAVARDMRPQLEALKNQAARYYAMQFSPQELKQVLAFYKSPVGMKLIAAEPKIVNQSMAYSRNWAVNVSDQVLAKFRDEMHKRGHDL
jgi:uncharacterized protein